MRTLQKAICLLFCIYVLCGKIYQQAWYLQMGRQDWLIIVSDLICVYACILFALLILRLIKEVRHQKIHVAILLGAAVAQVYISLLNMLIRTPAYDHKNLLLLYDIPNILSVGMMIALIVCLTKKKQNR